MRSKSLSCRGMGAMIEHSRTAARSLHVEHPREVNIVFLALEAAAQSSVGESLMTQRMVAIDPAAASRPMALLASGGTVAQPVLIIASASSQYFMVRRPIPE